MADVYASDDPGEDIAAALATFINQKVADQPSPLPFPCFAKVSEDPKAELELEHTTIQVLFFPSTDEDEEKIGRGGQITETYGVSMIVCRQVSAEFNRKVMSRFVRVLKKQIRQAVRMAGYVYSRAETTSKFDPQRINKQFASSVELYYRGTA